MVCALPNHAGRVGSYPPIFPYPKVEVDRVGSILPLPAPGTARGRIGLDATFPNLPHPWMEVEGVRCALPSFPVFFAQVGGLGYILPIPAPPLGGVG